MAKHEAMAPIFRLLSEAEGEPEEVIPFLLIMLINVRKWAEKHPSKDPLLFDGSLNDMERRLKEDWVNEGQPR